MATSRRGWEKKRKGNGEGDGRGGEGRGTPIGESGSASGGWREGEKGKEGSLG